jgi:hypothetical protein
MTGKNDSYGVQLGLPIEPVNYEEMFVDQTKFLPHNYSEDRYSPEWWHYYTPALSSREIHRMDSDYCERIRFQEEHDPDFLKKKLLERVNSFEKLWKDYFKKNARIFKSETGTLTFVNTELEKLWQDEKKKTDEMMKFVGESPEHLREDIICNPHIHACIKENLLGNLDRILKEKGLNIRKEDHHGQDI